MLSAITFSAAFAVFASTASAAIVADGGRSFGRATVYLPAQWEGGGPAYCTGILEPDDSFVVAVKRDDFHAHKNEGRNLCNTCVSFTSRVLSPRAGEVGTVKTVKARVVDHCEGPGCRDFDMSLGLFRQWQGVDVRDGKPHDEGPGYIEFDYQFVPCDSEHDAGMGSGGGVGSGHVHYNYDNTKSYSGRGLSTQSLYPTRPAPRVAPAPAVPLNAKPVAPASKKPFAFGKAGISGKPFHTVKDWLWRPAH